MKSLKSFALFCTALSAISGYADGGGSSDAGNGGQGVVCTSNGVETWMLRDLWEIENVGDRQHRKYPVTRSETPYQEQIQAVVERVRAIAPDYAQALEYTLADIARPEVRQAVDPNMDLPITRDLGFSLNGIDCRTVQLADYHTRLGTRTLWMDNEYIARLPQTDRAALELHEAIYRMERVNFNARNSEHTRLVVGLLMSGVEISAAELKYPAAPDSFLRHARVTTPEQRRRERNCQIYGGGYFCPNENASSILLWDFLPVTSLAEMSGDWVYEENQLDLLLGRVDLRIESSGRYKFVSRFMNTGHRTIELFSCQGEAFSGTLPVQFENTGCLHKKHRTRALFEFRPRRAREAFRGSEQELLEYLGVLEPFNLTAATLKECRLITAQGDRMLCRVTVPGHLEYPSTAADGYDLLLTRVR